MFIRLFQSESKTWNIQHLLHKIGQMIEVTLLLHAFHRCNTVFRIYGIGRDKIAKSLKLLNICCDLPPTFYNQLNSKLDIQEAGENLFFGLYNRANITSLKKLRHKIFIKEQLPPTTDSPKYSPEGG